MLSTIMHQDVLGGMLSLRVEVGGGNRELTGGIEGAAVVLHMLMIKSEQ